ncbi:MAG TPA: hypothetical protein VE111_05780 [Bradyrhizobium sp.]|nr:hypothetical protein [Bradyrhizobium sp.]
MRLFAMLAAICLLSPSALAETPECKTIPAASARLACYDKAAVPASADKSAAAKPAATAGAAAAKPGAADTIGAEDARMNAQLKNICRGC